MVSASCNIVFKPTLSQHPYFKPCSICPWIGWINHKHTNNKNKSYTKTEWIWTTYVLKTCQVPFRRLKHGVTVIFCQVLFLGEEESVGLLMKFWVVKCAHFPCLFQNTRQQREKKEMVKVEEIKHCWCSQDPRRLVSHGRMLWAGSLATADVALDPGSLPGSGMSSGFSTQAFFLYQSF